MARYVLGRLLNLPVVLIIVAVMVFFLRFLTPGDPAVLIAGPDASLEEVQLIREELGLNDPPLRQMVLWFSRLLAGDLGKSVFIRQSVTQVIIDRIEPTLLLATYALLVAVFVGVPAGIVSAVRSNCWIDYGAMSFALFGLCVPHFFLGLIFILVFSIHVSWFPVGGYSPLTEGPLATLRHLTLPAVGLGLGQAGLIARMTRAAMLGVLAEEYIRVARAKGLHEWTVIVGHAFRNAVLPTVTVIGVSASALLGGAVVMEIVFNLNGIGRMIVTAVLRRDYPLLHGGVLFVAAMAVLVNLLVDVLYVCLDPRIRYGK